MKPPVHRSVAPSFDRSATTSLCFRAGNAPNKLLLLNLKSLCGIYMLPIEIHQTLRVGPLKEGEARWMGAFRPKYRRPRFSRVAEHAGRSSCWYRRRRQYQVDALVSPNVAPPPAALLGRRVVM